MDSLEGSQQTHLVLAHKRFLLTHTDVQEIDKVRLKEEVFSMVKADDMAWFYETLMAESVLEMDQSVLDSMRTNMSSRKLMGNAEENLGESEVREAHLAKSLFYIQIGDKEKALEQLKATEGKTVAVKQ